MTQDEIIEMVLKAHNSPTTTRWWDMDIVALEAFAKLIAQHERKKAQDEIDTLYEMYKLVCSQRDELMDQQRAQVAALRGKIQ